MAPEKIQIVPNGNALKTKWSRAIRYGDLIFTTAHSATRPDGTMPTTAEEQIRGCFESLKNTLCHELLHTCYGCMKHTGRWKAYAERVNAAYGLNIKRAAAAGDREIPEELLPKANYLVRCESCGTEYGRQKLSPLIQHPERYRCGKCKGKLNRIK